MPDMPTLASLAADLVSGATSARKLVEQCLVKIAEPAGEGQRAFLHVDKNAALDAANAMDRLRKTNPTPWPLRYIPYYIMEHMHSNGLVMLSLSRARQLTRPAQLYPPT